MATRRNDTYSGKKPAKKAAKASSTKAAKSNSGVGNYTRPELRQKIKKRVVAGSKGGRPGQWSPRKAQIIAHEYEAEGGGFKNLRNPAQESLKKWGEERWRTANGKQAIHGKLTHRYLPDTAWKELSLKERKATDRKKVAGSKRGRQFVANTSSAANARKRATRLNGS